jgi:hypothetical protein
MPLPNEDLREGPDSLLGRDLMADGAVRIDFRRGEVELDIPYIEEEG